MSARRAATRAVAACMILAVAAAPAAAFLPLVALAMPVISASATIATTLRTSAVVARLAQAGTTAGWAIITDQGRLATVKIPLVAAASMGVWSGWTGSDNTEYLTLQNEYGDQHRTTGTGYVQGVPYVSPVTVPASGACYAAQLSAWWTALPGAYSDPKGRGIEGYVWVDTGAGMSARYDMMPGNYYSSVFTCAAQVTEIPGDLRGDIETAAATPTTADDQAVGRDVLQAAASAWDTGQSGPHQLILEIPTVGDVIETDTGPLPVQSWVHNPVTGETWMIDQTGDAHDGVISGTVSPWDYLTGNDTVQDIPATSTATTTYADGTVATTATVIDLTGIVNPLSRIATNTADAAKTARDQLAHDIAQDEAWRAEMAARALPTDLMGFTQFFAAARALPFFSSVGAAYDVALTAPRPRWILVLPSLGAVEVPMQSIDLVLSYVWYVTVAMAGALGLRLLAEGRR